MKLIIRVMLLTSIAFFVAYAGDPVVGVWKLDVLHSRFSSEPPPRSEIRTYVQTGEGTKVTVKTVDAKGKESTIEYPMTFDGKDHVQPGTAAGATVTLTKDNDYHASAVLNHAGSVLANVERTISSDGATMTITYKGKNESGDPIDKLMIYHRVADDASR